MATKRTKRLTKKVKDLPAKTPASRQQREVRGGRDAASGLPTGKRMHKPFTFVKESGSP